MNQLEERRQQILKMQQRQQARQQQQMLQPQTAVGNLGGAAGRRSYKADEAQAELDKIKLQQQKLEQTLSEAAPSSTQEATAQSLRQTAEYLEHLKGRRVVGALGQLGEL